MSAAKKIILLLWLVILASLGNVSALTPGTTETCVWQKSLATVQTRQAEPLETAGRHQENGRAAYDVAPDSLLAAEGGGLELTAGAQQTLAGTQNGVLLGTVENGQINLFQSGVGQIMGHSDLVNAGLVSPGAQGFSIGLESGQVTTLWQNSILNPASANYLLPAQTTQQILNTLGATGAKLFP